MAEVEEFLSGLGAPAREVFEHISRLAHEVAPEAEEGTGYGLPALRYRGKPLIGFKVAKNHLSVVPFSSEAVEAVRGSLDGYDVSKGTIRFSAENPPPDVVLRELLTLRKQEIDGG